MMDISLLSSGMMFLITISWPLLVAILLGGVVAALIQGATQVHDQAIAFTVKLTAAFVALYFLGVSMFSKIAAYSSALWGTSEFFH